MTLRILEARSGGGALHEPAPQHRKGMPFDPVADSINTAEAAQIKPPRPSSSASQHEARDSLRTALLRSNTDTEGRRLLSSLPVRRAWKGPAIDLKTGDDAIAEAVMVYERGRIQPPEGMCSRCRRGHGTSPECVKVDAYRDGACSNCLLARAAPPAVGGARPSPSRDFSPARRFITAAVPASTAREDMAAVWKVIAGVLATQRDDCRIVDDAGQHAAARRIEDAALLVARSADEWGHAVEDGDEAATRAKRRTEGERAKLVTQASRIRDTALRIAECARAWGEQQAAGSSP
ncbi:hypothetical protein F5X68DRAFT_187951 [Plectosphaerella plurivora]|uniref:Uncharacterized protein n=1 Tax=Plectosphaerella plurivora TaxID=936078 RepID=A0A9P9AFP9_9PEZI|nr:hypothetical protein F5X68DRAFT_187951 [Plectosphaerella plurivora]